MIMSRSKRGRGREIISETIANRTPVSSMPLMVMHLLGSVFFRLCWAWAIVVGSSRVFSLPSLFLVASVGLSSRRGLAEAFGLLTERSICPLAESLALRWG